VLDERGRASARGRGEAPIREAAIAIDHGLLVGVLSLAPLEEVVEKVVHG
jgi:hypothetical protein